MADLAFVDFADCRKLPEIEWSYCHIEPLLPAFSVEAIEAHGVSHPFECSSFLLVKGTMNQEFICPVAIPNCMRPVNLSHAIKDCLAGHWLPDLSAD
jgi:hypothetical protein